MDDKKIQQVEKLITESEDIVDSLTKRFVDAELLCKLCEKPILSNQPQVVNDDTVGDTYIRHALHKICSDNRNDFLKYQNLSVSIDLKIMR